MPPWAPTRGQPDRSGGYQRLTREERGDALERQARGPPDAERQASGIRLRAPARGVRALARLRRRQSRLHAGRSARTCVRAADPAAAADPGFDPEKAYVEVGMINADGVHENARPRSAPRPRALGMLQVRASRTRPPVHGGRHPQPVLRRRGRRALGDPHRRGLFAGPRALRSRRGVGAPDRQEPGRGLRRGSGRSDAGLPRAVGLHEWLGFREP